MSLLRAVGADALRNNILAELRERGGTITWKPKNGGRPAPAVATPKKPVTASDLHRIAEALAAEGAQASDPARRSALLNQAGRVAIRAASMEEPSAKELTQAEVDQLVAEALHAAGMDK